MQMHRFSFWVFDYSSAQVVNKIRRKSSRVGAGWTEYKWLNVSRRGVRKKQQRASDDGSKTNGGERSQREFDSDSSSTVVEYACVEYKAHASTRLAYLVNKGTCGGWARWTKRSQAADDCVAEFVLGFPVGE